jgi:hypothetical protein
MVVHKAKTARGVFLLETLRLGFPSKTIIPLIITFVTVAPVMPKPNAAFLVETVAASFLSKTITARTPNCAVTIDLDLDCIMRLIVVFSVVASLYEQRQKHERKSTEHHAPWLQGRGELATTIKKGGLADTVAVAHTIHAVCASDTVSASPRKKYHTTYPRREFATMPTGVGFAVKMAHAEKINAICVSSAVSVSSPMLL